MKAEVPNNWCRTTIGEAFIVTLGQSPPSSTYNNQGEGLPFYQGKAEFGEIHPVTRTWCRRPKKIAYEGDVLLSVRAPVGPTNIAPEKCCIGRGLASISSVGDMGARFILYFFRYVESQLAQAGTGTTFSAITGEKLKGFPTALAPLPEQHRIVAKIEELFTKLDAGVEALNQAQAQLKRYRQSVLKAAMEGRITAEWRELHKDELESAEKLLKRILKNRREKWEAEQLAKYKANGKTPPKKWRDKYKKSTWLNTTAMPELPKGWVYGKLENFIYIAGRIGWRGLKAEEYTADGPLFLSVYNLNKGRNVNFLNAYHISKERYDESPEIQLKNDDILLVKDGSGIGKIGIVKELNAKATVNSSLLVIRSEEVFIQEFLLYFLMGPGMQSIVRQRITGSATPHLFQRDIRQFTLQIPPIEEQKKIVEEIERSLSVIEGTELLLKSELKRAQSLRQSILKRAFEGKLAPQDANDEPATVLLERIRAEKTQSKKSIKSEIQ